MSISNAIVDSASSVQVLSDLHPHKISAWELYKHMVDTGINIAKSTYAVRGNFSMHFLLDNELGHEFLFSIDCVTFYSMDENSKITYEGIGDATLRYVSDKIDFERVSVKKYNHFIQNLCNNEPVRIHGTWYPVSLVAKKILIK